MRILFVADKLNVNRGGASRSLHIMASRLNSRGHEVTVLTTNISHINSPPPDHPYFVEELGQNKGNIASIIREVIEYFRREEDNYDIVHIFSPQLNFAGGIYRKRGGQMPVIGRLNNYTFCTNKSQMNTQCFKNCTIKDKFVHDYGDRHVKLAKIPKYVFKTKIEGGLVNYLDKLHAISPSVKHIYSYNGVEESNIKVVPNFIDYNFNPETEEVMLSNKENDILYIGRLEEMKGVKTLAKCAHSLNIDHQIHIIGDGPLKEELDRLGGDKVKLHGWIKNEELPKYYSSADLFVHPGTWPEPFGRTILESLQCETPVLVSDIGAPPWIAGNAGAKFTPGLEEDLADKLQYVLENEEVYSEMKKSTTSELKRFEEDKVIDKIIGTYKAVCS